MDREKQLLATFVELADTLTSEYELSEFLHVLVARLAEVLASDAVGVLLPYVEGGLGVAAVSTDKLENLELFQLQSSEGPCQDAIRTGRQVLDADLGQAHERWPGLVPRALLAGYRSVHAFPMRLRDQTIGALNFFDSRPGRLSSSDVAAAQALADVATIGILQERAIREATDLSGQLQYALSRRGPIEMAKGILIERTGAPPREAFEALRRYARSHHEEVYAVATALLEKVVTPEQVIGEQGTSSGSHG